MHKVGMHKVTTQMDSTSKVIVRKGSIDKATTHKVITNRGLMLKVTTQMDLTRKVIVRKGSIEKDSTHKALMLQALTETISM
jgi:hypothetical protein